MDVTKEHLIKKLIKEGKINEDDANVLRREEKEIQYIPTSPVNPFPQIVSQPYRQKTWIESEMDRRAGIAARCGCNPANGGSGVCGCTLTGPIIT